MLSVDQLDPQQLHREYLTELHIRSFEPDIYVELKSNKAWLFMAAETPESRGIFDMIKDDLLSRQRSWSPSSEIWMIVLNFVLSLVISTSAGLLLGGIIIGNWPISIAGLFFCFLAVVWMWWNFKVFFRQHSLIILKWRIDHESFWQRNKDAIVNISIALGAAIVGFVLGKL